MPLVVIAGKDYGSGSSRDWAAKGPALLGVRAVLAVSFERFHRSNLIGMGILPLQFLPGESAQSWEPDQSAGRFARSTSQNRRNASRLPFRHPGPRARSSGKPARIC